MRWTRRSIRDSVTGRLDSRTTIRISIRCAPRLSSPCWHEKPGESGTDCPADRNPQCNASHGFRNCCTLKIRNGQAPREGRHTKVGASAESPDDGPRSRSSIHSDDRGADGRTENLALLRENEGAGLIVALVIATGDHDDRLTSSDSSDSGRCRAGCTSASISLHTDRSRFRGSGESHRQDHPDNARYPSPTSKWQRRLRLILSKSTSWSAGS